MSKIGKSVSSLVSTVWLAETLSKPPSNFRVLDGSWHMPFKNRDPRAEYNIKHIPGAQFFGVDECCDKSTSMSHMIPSSTEFATYVGKLGINNSTHVVIYDNNDDFGLFSAQRVWWTFRVFGHSMVSVLDGGLSKWEKEGNKITDVVDEVETQEYVANYESKLVKSFDDVANNIISKQFTVVDARSAGRFQGTAPEPRPEIESGHIPGSVNIPFTELLDLKKGTLKQKDELQEVFKNAKVDLSSNLVGSCGTGISACLLALSAHLLGNEDFAVYDGSWTEWYQKSSPEQRAKSK